MPELPEVETIKRQFDRFLPGKTLKAIELLDDKTGRYLPSSDIRKIIGHKVTKVGRRAKVLLVHFDNTQVLAFHLKMTGQIILESPAITHLPNKHTRAILKFKDRTIVFFQDLRKFGWLKVVPEKNLASGLFKEKLGPEPFDPIFSLAYFTKELGKAKKPVKLFLLDQSKLAGVGNIYANEALFLAKIHPQSPSNQLTAKEVERLYLQILAVLKKGIKLGGASDNSYLDAFGQKGSFQNHFLVYRRKGQPCLVCKSMIKRIALGGRGTFYCPRCQK